tara:strand:+ start:69 stop:374 length:306 start_codon:yes stop_codon:yes gene_type:complete
MAKRYDKLNTKTFEGKRGKKEKSNYKFTVQKPRFLSSVPKRNDDIFVVTQDGDRLDHLANEYYGDANLWWYIAKANNLKFITIKVGSTLRIPRQVTPLKGY